MKYIAGSIFSKYAPTPEGLRQAMADPEFKQWFPNAKLIGFDKIDFGGQLSDFEKGTPVNVVDVGELFDPNNNTGARWVWQDQNFAGGPAIAPPGGGGSYARTTDGPHTSLGPQAFGNIGNSEFVQQLIAYLMNQLAIGRALQ